MSWQLLQSFGSNLEAFFEDKIIHDGFYAQHS